MVFVHQIRDIQVSDQIQNLRLKLMLWVYIFQNIRPRKKKHVVHPESLEMAEYCWPPRVMNGPMVDLSTLHSSMRSLALWPLDWRERLGGAECPDWSPLSPVSSVFCDSGRLISISHVAVRVWVCLVLFVFVPSPENA